MDVLATISFKIQQGIFSVHQNCKLDGCPTAHGAYLFAKASRVPGRPKVNF